VASSRLPLSLAATRIRVALSFRLICDTLSPTPNLLDDPSDYQHGEHHNGCEDQQADEIGVVHGVIPFCYETGKQLAAVGSDAKQLRLSTLVPRDQVAQPFALDRPNRVVGHRASDGDGPRHRFMVTLRHPQSLDLGAQLLVLSPQSRGVSKVVALFRAV
jgi:hypothetical protein